MIVLCGCCETLFLPARDSCLCSVCLGLQCALPSEGNERARNGNKQTYFLFHLGHPAICLVFFFRSAIRLPHKFSFLSGNDRLLRRYKLNRFRPPKEDAMTFENRRVLLKNTNKRRDRIVVVYCLLGVASCLPEAHTTLCPPGWKAFQLDMGLG